MAKKTMRNDDDPKKPLYSNLVDSAPDVYIDTPNGVACGALSYSHNPHMYMFGGGPDVYRLKINADWCGDRSGE
jgi:hypothetical protein